MAQSFGIGRIFGIGIELHWTFILLMLFTLLLSTYLFVLILLLFVCVLVHELAHSVTSLRNGIKVKKIILLPIGGASIIDETKLRPETEFGIAISGPLMSLFLGCAFGVLVIFAPPGTANMLLQYLFEINLLLGVFNLLPAFPTDGARVFRSWLERKHGEYEATMMTVTASKWVMALFVLGTVVYLALISAPLYYKEFTLLWDLIIVIFLYGGAVAERQAATLKREAKGVGIGGAVNGHFRLVRPDSTVAELYALVRKTKEHVLITPLGDGFAYVNLMAKVKQGSVRRAADLAVKIPSIAANAGIIEAIQAMENAESGIAVVVRRGKLVGVLTMSGLQSFLALHVLNKRQPAVPSSK